jgi:hypothetical protein
MKGIGPIIGGCLLAAAAPAQHPTPESPPAPQARLDYGNVPFTARLINNEDRRFQLATPEWRFRGGVGLTSRDPALYSISWFDGGATSGRLRDGRAIVILPYAFGSAPVTGIRVAQTPELAGGYTGRTGLSVQAPSHPHIPGYRYVMSENFFGAREYLGLWQRIRGRDETLILCFRPASDGRYRSAPEIPAMHRIVGRLPLRLSSLFIYSGLHGVTWQLNFTSEARIGRPIYILHYEWMRKLNQPRDRPLSQC